MPALRGWRRADRRGAARRAQPAVVAEAIVNAVAHRDYASNTSVQVMLFADRLEVWNPGVLPQPLTPERLRRAHPSIPRNPLVAEPMFLASYIEKAGTGTLDMIRRLKAAGLPGVEFVQEGGFFVQKVRRPEGGGSESGSESRLESRSESRLESRPESSAAWWTSVPVWRPEWDKRSLHHRIMVALKRSPLTRAELALALSHRGISSALRKATGDLRRLGFITFTIPGKPGSRLQRYKAVRPVVE